MLELERLVIDELLPLRLPSFVEKTHEQQIAWRAYGFGAWRRGELSFLDCVRNLLPGRFKPGALQRTLQTLLGRELADIFEKSGLYSSTATLFGNPFYPTKPGAFKNWFVALRLLNEVILQDEYRSRGRIREDAVVIDAGANVGTFSAFAANLAKRGQIYAFEPTHATFEILKENLKPYAHAMAIQSALGNRVDTTELLIESASGEGNTLSGSGMGGSYSCTETVPVTTIDAFVREHNLPHVDFIKADTEGYEKEILEGAKETIQRYRPALSLSAYHKPGDPERLRDLIVNMCSDYHCELKSSPELDLICDSLPSGA